MRKYLLLIFCFTILISATPAQDNGKKQYKAELQNLMQRGLSQEEAENNSTLMAQAREMLRKWENADEEIRNPHRRIPKYNHGGRNRHVWRLPHHYRRHNQVCMCGRTGI